MRIARNLVVEFIGTFFLVFTFGMAMATAGSLAPLAIGGVLMVMVFAGGHVSGGYFNPAVSVAAFLRGRLSAPDCGAYIVAQAVAALAAAGVVGALGYDPAMAFILAGSGKMLIAEFIFTFALAYVVLHVATAGDTAGNSFYGLAIGSTMAVGMLTVGAISIGVFNPALAFGLCVMGMVTWGHFWVYLVAGFAGGIVAALAYQLTQSADEPSPAAVPASLRFRRAESEQDPSLTLHTTTTR